MQARTCITRIIYALEHPPWGTKIYALSHLSIISSLDHHVFSNKIFVCIPWSGSSTYALYNIERLSYTTSIVSVRYYYVSHHVICVLKLFLQDYGMSIQLQKKKSVGWICTYGKVWYEKVLSCTVQMIIYLAKLREYARGLRIWRNKWTIIAHYGSSIWQA